MIQHKKNTAYYLSFPMVDSAVPANFKSGLSPVDTAYYKDGAGAWTSLSITDTATEIGSTGLYELDLTAAELNHDYVIIKFAVSGAADTAFLFNMVNNDAIVDQVWDESLTGASHNIANSAGRRLRQAQEFQGYEGGQIWIDTVSGTAGAVAYDNGTVEAPVDNLTDANTVAAALNYTRYRIHAGSTIVLNQAYTAHVFAGESYTLDLNGQNIDSSKILGAALGVSGVCTGTFPFFYECSIGNISIQDGAFQTCGLTGTITVTGIGDLYLVDCFSQVAGVSTPSLDMGAAVGASNVSMRRYSGGIEIQNLGAGDNISIEGNGQIVINANCSGGTIAFRGNFALTDNSGSVTVVRQSPADKDEVAGTIFTSQLTESYAADGVAPTLAQALMLIQQKLGDFSISGSTLTVKQLDGSTTAATYTLDDPANPTSITRAT
jgi:hypothetical protein